VCAGNEGEGGVRVGSASSSLLRPLALVWPALLVGGLLWITSPAAAAGSPAPDPAPAVQPDAYQAPTRVPASPAPSPVVTAPEVSQKAVSGSQRPHRSQHAPSIPDHVVHPQVPGTVVRPQIRFPLPTLFANWLRDSAVEPARAGSTIPAEVGLAVAALVLLSAGFVAAAAREVRR